MPGSFVFTEYGEVSTDVETLLDIAATERAARDWRQLGARSQAEARAITMALMRRYLGVIGVREMARHRLRRVPYVGLTRAQMRARQARVAHLATGDRLHEPRIRPEDFWGAEVHMRTGGRDAVVPPDHRAAGATVTLQ